MKKVLLFLLFSTLGFAQSSSILESEKAALIALYNSTDGANWSIKWDLSADPSKWYGVKTKNSVVTEIHLGGNLLKGNLPALISNLPHLERLDLSSNQLSGEIPASVNSLTGLKYLNLSKNDFTGDVTNSLSSLVNLEELYLGNNHFTLSGADNFLDSFKHATVLDLSAFSLNQVPQKISQFQNLKTLNLSNNALTQGFGNLAALSSLTDLDLSGNSLSAIPAQISTLSGLKSFDFSHNLLAANPTVLANFKNLEWLSLEDNQLTEIPSAIGQMQNLVHLNLGRNLITGNFAAVSSLKNLQQLWLNNNKLSGSFPTDLLAIPQLQMLCLNSNQLSGSLPENLPQITQISNNRFTRSDLENQLSLNQNTVEFNFSPQRYDEANSIAVPIGGSAKLEQSLSGTDYDFYWFKNLDENMGVNTENHTIFNISEADYGFYTCEAFLALPNLPGIPEISFFREPIKLDNGLATDENNLKGLTIYPNPTADFINIRSEKYKIEKVFIYDLGGRLLVTDTKTRINVTHFPSAAYLITIKTESGYKTFKFIKQ